MVRKARKSARKQTPEARLRDAEFERRLLKDPRFLKRIESARKSLRAGRGVRIRDVEW
jgi:hypothetical protein